MRSCLDGSVHHVVASSLDFESSTATAYPHGEKGSIGALNNYQYYFGVPLF